MIDLVRDEAVPQEARHGPEQRAGIGPERAGLDERDAGPTAEIGRPVDRVIAGIAPPATRCGAATPVADRGVDRRLRPFEKLRWKADAVGSDWPWYLEPSSGLPYGRSTGSTSGRS